MPRFTTWSSYHTLLYNSPSPYHIAFAAATAIPLGESDRHTHVRYQYSVAALLHGMFLYAFMVAALLHGMFLYAFMVTVMSAMVAVCRVAALGNDTTSVVLCASALSHAKHAYKHMLDF
jgi:hypothetical protein